MKGFSNMVSALILLFILISLFPLIYSTYHSESQVGLNMASESLSESVQEGMIKIGIKRISPYKIIIYNYGESTLYLDKVYVDGVPRNISIFVFNGSWIPSRLIDSNNFALIYFDEPVSSYLTFFLNDTPYSIDLGGVG